MGDKSIDTNTFSFGDEANYVNLTTNKVIVGPSHFNNQANLFVYDNATYEFVTFKMTGGRDPATGHYLSDVGIDLGNNGRFEYRFGGNGVGQWGNQTSFMNSEYTSLKKGEAYPSKEGDLYYIKLPSDSVVRSTTVNLTHLDEAVTKRTMIPSSNNWGRGYMYHYNYYPYGYSYFYPAANAGTYAQSNNYPSPSDYSYASGYPMENAYLKWDINSDAFKVPVGADIKEYELNWPIQMYKRSGSFPGYSGSYHYGDRYYKLYGVTSSWPTSYQYTSTIYYDTNLEWSEFKRINPTWRDTPDASYFSEGYHGSSSATYYDYSVKYDLIDLLEEWNSQTLANNGIMITMAETPYCDGFPQWTGYSYYSNRANYYQFYYRGTMYSPGASSSYNAYKPVISLSYVLDSKNPWIDVGDDEVNDWSYSGTFVGSNVVSGFQGPINNYLRTHFPDEIDDYGNSFTYVPVRLGADTAGKISISDFKVEYDYQATVFYNPASRNLLNELQSLIPITGEGYSLLEINVTSSTEGALEFSNLRLVGEKPNYAPRSIDVQDIETHEGVQESRLLAVSDHFWDQDQEASTLHYLIQKNDHPDHVDLYLWKDVDDTVWLGIDTTRDENWNGGIECQLSATDEFGKYVFSNQFKINVEPVNDPPYAMMMPPDMITNEGVDPILLEYQAPEGRGIASGKEVFVVEDGGSPYFADVEGQYINLDFELLGPDMMPVNLAWYNEDGHKIYRGADNRIYMTVLPPEYTDDPDNWLILFGSDPDFSTGEDSYHLKIYASDDPYDLNGQANVTFSFTVNAQNDPPDILPIPDVTLNEDGTFVSTYVFIDEYISDRDNDMGDLQVSFISANEDVMVSLDPEGHLVIELGMDFNGVVPITVEVFDGSDFAISTFNVRVRSINDAPFLNVGNLYNGQVISGMFLVKGTANDIEKQLKSVELAIVPLGDVIYADDWQLTQGLYVWQFLMDIRYTAGGSYTIYVRAFDGKDFSQVTSFDVTIEPLITLVNSKPPEVSISTPMLGDQSDTITVTGTVSDDSGVVSFVEYRVDGGIWRKASLVGDSEWNVIINTRRLSNEEHNLSVRAYDEKLYSDIAFRRFDVFNEDSDGDGIPNDIEVSLLMDPFNKLDGTMDFDGDGYSNQEELMVYNTDPFSGISVPEDDGTGSVIDTWAVIFIVAALLCAAVIIGLFVLNIRMERNIHLWRENLGRRRAERKPKTLLQRIVEIAPTHLTYGGVPEGPTLPGQSYTEQDMLPPMQE
ncbi:MAG: Ig-like domain-containing protein [Thermoplasmatota archaeon]